MVERTLDFRGLFEAAPGLFLVLTTDLTIVAVSDAYLAATMTRRDDIVGRPLFEVFPDNPADPGATGVSNLRRSLETVLKTGAPDTMPVQKYDIRRPDGGFEERYWSPVNAPVRGDDGTLAYIIHRVEDVTEARLLERLKTDFFANVSHEFRTPLTLLMGPLEQVLRDVSAPHHAAIEIALRNGQRLLKLVNTLLDFTRLEAGSAGAAFHPVELAAFTDRIASAFHPAAQDAGLEFVRRCPPLPQPVYVDPEMWEKIVWNLLSNALKFTDAGRITLELGRTATHAELTVTDTGCGIPPEEQARIFQRFHRIRGASARSHEGTGIGLSLVHELVQLLGGQVQVVSAPGQGSTFRVLIPFGHAHLPREQVQAAAPAPTSGSTAAGFLAEFRQWNAGATGDAPPAGAADRPRVLVVDDNADMRTYLTNILSPHWNVETQPDGRAALDSIRQRRPALVISDVMMPALDGLALSGKLRADPRTAELPLILLSARTGEDATVDGLRAGAADYLVKPFAPRELVARVQAHLELARLRAQRLDAVGQLASKIAHDFNNLLTVINGGTDLALADQRLPADVADNLLDVRSCGDRAAKLTHQLLAFSRKQILRLGPVHANSVMAKLAATPGLVPPEIRLRVEPTPGADLIRTDPGQLEHALLNLVANARDAMPDGGDLTLRTALVTRSDGSYLKLSVIDTGVGMTADARRHLFEPFHAHAGLGLATVHGIVGQCDGHIEVESAPGAGTSIDLYFPRLPLEEVPPEPRATPLPLELLRARTVLVVDDDPGVRKFIAGVLRSRGLEPLLAGDGEDALALAAAHASPIDLLVTDALMPRMSGHQLIRELRAYCPELKVLIVSGVADEILAAHSRGDPDIVFLAKPFSPQALAEHIQLLLGAIQ